MPYSGPLDAELVVIGESPASREVQDGEALVGPSGQVFNMALAAAGIARGDVRLLNAIPCRAPGDQYDRHAEEDRHWGLRLLADELHRAERAGAKLLMPLGENPLAAIRTLPRPPSWSSNEDGERGRISAWRGSLVPLRGQVCDVASYEAMLYPWDGLAVLPSFHPAYIHRNYPEHPWIVIDFQRAKRFLDGEWEWPRQREWFLHNPGAFEEYVEYIIEHEHLIAFDTESYPANIVAVAGEEQVHVFTMEPEYMPALRRLMESEWVLKAAHNLGHDVTHLKVRCDVEVKPPFVDTGGLSHILHPTRKRNLSPALTTQFTTYPYHKWLVEHDPWVYCGYDTVAAYDIYWPAVEQIQARGLLPVADHDHELMKHLLDMQHHGVLVDEARRLEAVEVLKKEYRLVEERVQAMADEVVRTKIDRFRKPHLFRSMRSCDCCGGGSVARVHCWRCGGLEAKPERKADYEAIMGEEARWTVAQARERLPMCKVCEGVGRVEQWTPLNLDGREQVGDVLYRGMGIRPRTYKRKETVRLDQLEPLAEQYPIVAGLIEAGSVGQELETMQRLAPDPLDGRVHATFDPWGTPSGRVACREGLVQKGTALQNIPVRLRHVLIAPDGYVMWAPDMAQIEGRCVAVITKDPGLWRAYREPVDWPGHPKHGTIDSHTVVQQMVSELGVDIDRNQSKVVSYAGFYGVTPEQLAVELTAWSVRRGGGKVTASEAAQILRALYRAFPGLEQWHEQDVDEVRRTRRLVSPTGRVFEWTGRITRVVRRKGERYTEVTEKIRKEIWSRKPQDMAAWVLALGLQRLREQWGELLTPLIHVHDELVTISAEADVEQARQAIEESMTVEQWGMTFPVDVGNFAPNWACAKEVHSDDGAGRCRHCGQSV